MLTSCAHMKMNVLKDQSIVKHWKIDFGLSKQWRALEAKDTSVSDLQDSKAYVNVPFRKKSLVFQISHLSLEQVFICFPNRFVF